MMGGCYDDAPSWIIALHRTPAILLQFPLPKRSKTGKSDSVSGVFVVPNQTLLSGSHARCVAINVDSSTAELHQFSSGHGDFPHVTKFTEQPSPPPGPPAAQRSWQQLLDRHHWLPFVLPYALFLLLSLLEPTAAPQSPQAEPQRAPWSVAADAEPTVGPGAAPAAAGSWRYPLVYSLRICLTAACVCMVWPIWRRAPWTLHFSVSVTVGVVGFLLWVMLCHAQIEQRVMTALGIEGWVSWGGRGAYDPYAAMGDTPVLMVAFLIVRLAGLALVVPLIEEFFLRGFVMRFVDAAQWWQLPLGTVSWKSAIAATLYGVLAHPTGEAVAAAVWFSLVTALYARTRSIWDCVLAHLVTNGLLGVYVLLWQDWSLW